SVAGGLRRSGLSQAAMLAALKAENMAKCNPPLDEGEDEKNADRVARHAVSPSAKGEDPAEYAMRVLLHDSFDGGNNLMYFQDGQFWRFDGKKWLAAPRKWIEGRILRTIRQLHERAGQRTASLIKQVVTLLEGELAVEDDLLRFTAEPPPVINCQNGELWISEDGSVNFRKHRAESYLRQCLDVVYDPAAQCRIYDNALAEIFSDAEDE